MPADAQPLFRTPGPQSRQQVDGKEEIDDSEEEVYPQQSGDDEQDQQERDKITHDTLISEVRETSNVRRSTFDVLRLTF
jgi:hypothetical protein